ncbi:uncharacterized protein K452DRAFT_107726 [Aplosporella prunicola CBS 121167]|uniref:Uncharacterized protein n=1 Tax=Aplosporella prunicola CBS 121167 TaxID=1176127 RepID=A0A6A6BTS4_9PEZI|nr:uncharacterized protein K452DRAFT_107726 [Aplosporella prunicola CBS 121167]KAF2146227.1 hypothetical protein K452DRAFT_107726 [Aplosporella prunicola CBS 121167]
MAPRSRLLHFSHGAGQKVTGNMRLSPAADSPRPPARRTLTPRSIIIRPAPGVSRLLVPSKPGSRICPVSTWRRPCPPPRAKRARLQVTPVRPRVPPSNSARSCSKRRLTPWGGLEKGTLGIY